MIAYAQTAIVARLAEGPATARELARAIWGAEHAWPDTWNNCVRVAIYRLRSDRNVQITLQRVYSMDNTLTPERAIQRIMGD